MPAGSWAVVLDVDETTLDNSEHQRRLAMTGTVQNDSAWYAWIRERAAPPVPGAVEFTNSVRRLGGRVALVSNRDEPLCDATRDNVRTAGIAADVVLCRVNKVSDKMPRFKAVEDGAAGQPVRILAWVGDNIMDFPGLTQAARTEPGALDAFGTRYFMLPNPLYGSWQSNPRN
jgi:acid phosphatase